MIKFSALPKNIIFFFFLQLLKPYNFSYAVKDKSSNNDFGHWETSDGKTVTGSYRVLLPDGRTQFVTYKADGTSGYLADIEYEGAVHHPHYQSDYNANPEITIDSEISKFSYPATDDIPIMFQDAQQEIAAANPSEVAVELVNGRIGAVRSAVKVVETSSVDGPQTTRSPVDRNTAFQLTETTLANTDEETATSATDRPTGKFSVPDIDAGPVELESVTEATTESIATENESVVAVTVSDEETEDDSVKISQHPEVVEEATTEPTEVNTTESVEIAVTTEAF